MTPYTRCPSCGLKHLLERHTCKRCTHALDGSLPGSKSRSPMQAIRRWIIIVMVPAAIVALLVLFMVAPSLSDRRPFTIESTISRANRVIAIDDSHTPGYRWVFTTPQDYMVIGDNGSRPQHAPARITYGTGWTQPSRLQNTSIATDLTDREWQLVEAWRTNWCQTAPVLRPVIGDERFYTVALRCRGFDATTFRVPSAQLPGAISDFLRRSARAK